ncbi:hypothetical protein [uncultured Clostridium sp.]|uniref:hypothetical protein n=1 Tax=uncultured Clostridium sp. TaxID=59620 RepID=UPI0025CC6F6C|nr:hypothetical protein [uncultured Clostridium sp.]
MLSKEIITLKYNISLNNYEISILKKKIETLDSTREKYFKNLKDIVINKKYQNYCFSCEEDIDSESNEFCIKCGWYKCIWCKSCGCNYMNSTINKRYENFLKNNSEVKMLKDKIEQINVQKSLLNGQCNMMKRDNDLCNKKLKQFVNSGVKK